jgi:cysteine dioxygenase
MNTIDKLGSEITNKIINGDALKNTTDILQSYNGIDWYKHVTLTDSESYKKIQLFINNYIEIVLIVWNPNSGSKIHDHPTNGCILKIMEGSLIENIYVNQNNQLKFIETKQLNTNQISYQIGNKYLHNIDNLSDKHVCSLHVYSPPNFKINYY